MIKEDDIDVMNNKKEEIQEDKIHGNLVNVLLGKTLEEALEDIKNAGFTSRVTSKEGMPLVLTTDYNPYRLSLKIVGGIVSDVKFG